MLYDMMAQTSLAGWRQIYAPWSVSSMRPSAVRIILNDIIINGRKSVIEFGAGVSTLFIAEMLYERGGVLFTVDHDNAWLDTVRSMLRPQTRRVIRMIHAPLEHSADNGRSPRWYARKAIQTAIEPRMVDFDMVVVDGPAAYDKKRALARAPALPFLRGSCAANVTVVLDDICRSGERKVAAQWTRILGRDYSDLSVEAGIAVWMPRTGRNISVTHTQIAKATGKKARSEGHDF